MPAQATALKLAERDQVLFEIFQRLVIKLQPPFQHPRREVLFRLEECHDLSEKSVKVHHCPPPTPASPLPAAATRSSPWLCTAQARSIIGTGLLALAQRGIQLSRTPAAMGLERAHAELVGQGAGPAVVDCGLLAC